MTFSNICGRISAITWRILPSKWSSVLAPPHRPMTLHSPTENSLAVLNHKILEANSLVQNVKLGGHQTCLSINRLWHELCDMLRRLVEPQPLDIMIVQLRNEKLVIMALYRSPLTVTLWPPSFLKKYGPMIPPAHKAHQTVSFSGCNDVSTYTCGLASHQMRQFCLLT
ncbi:uncharacterized protein TNCV_315941 [Trichonephila clavipes]|nr:uncharacterized protein TNCV_315941 [Trichonephila clavipes]